MSTCDISYLEIYAVMGKLDFTHISVLICQLTVSKYEMQILVINHNRYILMTVCTVQSYFNF